ncbi:MAG: DUF1015 domain-containing protein [Eggerthellaceae bacterium]|jgi:uncharacterized protein (DUF1015 family)
MADLKPFAALRCSKENAETLSSLPYDVYSVEEARAIVEKNPLSFISIDEPKVHFLTGTSDPDEVYEMAGRLLRESIAAGNYRQDDKEQFYLYELTMDGRVQTGLVGLTSVDDYLEGIIMKHENTRSEKEAGRVKHVRACAAHTGPIFLAYRFNQTLADLYEKIKKTDPIFDFTGEDGIRHRGFAISDDEDIKTICDEFAKINRIYIADGHHRGAAAVKVALQERAERGLPLKAHDENNLHVDNRPLHTASYDYFMSVLFADEELRVFDYNRVVADLNGLSEEEFIEEMENIGTLETIGQEGISEDEIRPAAKGQVSVFLHGTWYRLTINPDIIPNDPVDSLDVALLQNLLLQPVLGIGDPRTDERIDFVGGIRGLHELERRYHEDATVAFAMYPTAMSELFAVADAGMLMPPKSTWFEPKLRSGLFIHPIEELAD